MLLLVLFLSSPLMRPLSSKVIVAAGRPLISLLVAIIPLHDGQVPTTWYVPLLYSVHLLTYLYITTLNSELASVSEYAMGFDFGPLHINVFLYLLLLFAYQIIDLVHMTLQYHKSSLLTIRYYNVLNNSFASINSADYRECSYASKTKPLRSCGRLGWLDVMISHCMTILPLLFQILLQYCLI